MIFLHSFLFSQTNDFNEISLEIEFKIKALKSMIEDCQSNILIGSDALGITKTDGYNHQLISSIDTNSIVDNRILTLFKDSKCRIWVGTRDGFSIILENEEIINYPYKKLSTFQEQITSGLLHTNVFSIYEENDSTFYLGTTQGISIFHLNNNRYENIRGTTVRAMVKDPKNSNVLWLGTSSGLSSLDLNTRQYSRHLYIDPLTQKTRRWQINNLVIDDNGILWMGGLWSGGLLKYNPDTKVWNRYVYDPSVAETDPLNNGIYDLEILNKDSIIFCNDQGLGIFDISREKLTYTPIRSEKNGQGVNSIYNLEIDRFGHILLSGFSSVYKSDFKVKNIISDHLKLNPYPQKLKINGKSKTSLSNFNQRIDSLNFNIASTNPPNKDQVHYKWRLKGHEEKYNYSIGQNVAQYANIGYGQFEFEYFVKHKESAPWEQGQGISLSSREDFYKTLWFKILLAILFLGLLYLLHAFRIRRIQSKADLESELIKTKIYALRSQMNPHFLYNTLNSINYFILNNDPKNATYYLSQFSKLMRKILNQSHSDKISLEDEIETLEFYIKLEQLRFKDAFTYKFNIDDKINLQLVKLPPMLIQPYVENAIWHGLLNKEGPGELIISIQMISEEVRISIKDNGIGRKASKALKKSRSPKQSIGMSLTRNRMDLFNDFYNSNTSVSIIDLENPTGTEVIISFPMNNLSKLTA